MVADVNGVRMVNRGYECGIAYVNVIISRRDKMNNWFHGGLLVDWIRYYSYTKLCFFPDSCYRVVVMVTSPETFLVVLAC